MLEADEAADIEEVQAWAAGLDALHARIAGYSGPVPIPGSKGPLVPCCPRAVAHEGTR